MIQDHPFAGIGLHNFKPMMPRYVRPGEEIASLAHNTYIELTAEVGFVGTMAFVAVFIAAIWTLNRVRRRAIALRCTYLANTALGMQAGVISYLISACFMTGWWDKMTWLLVFTCLALERTSRGWRALVRSGVPAFGGASGQGAQASDEGGQLEPVAGSSIGYGL
jgi:O-antigen ligase